MSSSDSTPSPSGPAHNPIALVRPRTWPRTRAGTCSATYTFQIGPKRPDPMPMARVPAATSQKPARAANSDMPKVIARMPETKAVRRDLPAIAG